MKERAQSSPAGVPEVRLGTAGAGLFVLMATLDVVGAGVTVAAIAYAVVVAGSCAVVPTRHALLLGVSAWALLTGFAVNALAQLTFAPADLERLLAFTVLALVASAAGRGVRRRSGSRRLPAYSQPFLRNAA